MIKRNIGQINADLYHVSTCSTQNGFRLNINKCTTYSEKGVGVLLDSESLAECEIVKTLGIVLDCVLNFSYITQRAIITLKGLCRFRMLLRRLTETATYADVSHVSLLLFSSCLWEQHFKRKHWHNPKAAELSDHVDFQPERDRSYLSFPEFCQITSRGGIVQAADVGGRGPQVRLEFGRIGFYYFVPSIYNDLSEHIKCIVSCRILR
ncbi:hypothetical protein J6590_076254 [Homalodisca vitripennis]|nr:hypothetical protein J6590_076254 [Homalodisca vitripennis]